ncbi:MAG: response regulator transcription factor [Gammaproteobacteria bacterium]
MRIALLEDDLDQAKLIEVWLSDAGHQSYIYHAGAQMVGALSKESFDVVMLDWEVPDMSGFEILQWIRENLDWSCPVLFITQRDQQEDVVKALEAGADDYMAKPVDRAEMLARINAIHRRNNPPDDNDTIFEISPYVVDLKKRTIMCNGDRVELTQKEYELALFILRNVGKVLSRGYLLERVWGKNPEINTRTVDTHVSRLRRKLAFDKENGWKLTSVYQHGYRLEPHVD